jgi:hypothetical protein
MKRILSTSLKLAIIAATLAASAVSTPALANGGYRSGHSGHGGHGHWRSSFSLHLGAPLFWPYYSYAPVYYPQPVVVAPAPQVIYVEQAQQPVAPPPAQQYWYYCSSPEGYYPNVQQCPSGWQKILPQPVR